ncbi:MULTISPECIES: hypothetical protein [Arthrobacter]|uniref:Uncharacterized protein n=1 Tax=Arthrobacter terricola TaxID=2547396 RepID=A0A4R5K2U3_9MICC|nr:MULTISPECIES: hypothetical protein [Arthrobacter]MBT8163859.1 hypothetical protein [Arthrobacter sp. GN70]TDF83665.1 hypothetical protein E1809_26140 [Arthrobacter terricola]
MSIEISDFTTLLGDTAVAEMAWTAETVTGAVRRVEEEHPGYSYSYSTEIRCDAWECSRYIELNLVRGVSTSITADEAYAAHRLERLDALLAELIHMPEDLGN